MYFNFRFLDESLYVLNYQFIKEFTKGVSDDWTINHINHVKMNDEIMEQTKEARKMFEKFKSDFKDRNKKD